jgi:hypothetical protein
MDRDVALLLAIEKMLLADGSGKGTIVRVSCGKCGTISWSHSLRRSLNRFIGRLTYLNLPFSAFTPLFLF